MEELIKKARKGDNQAFTELIQSIQNDLYRIAKIRLNNEDNVKDAIQNCIFNIYRNLDKLKKIEYFKTWAIKILINECNKIYHKIEKQYKLIEITDKKETIERDKAIKESNDKLDFELAMSHLNYEEKIVITLIYNNRYSCNEIAKILKTNVNTIKSRLLRGKEKLRKYYKGGIYYE